MRRMIVVLNQSQYPFLRKTEPAKGEIFPPYLVVPLKIPALKVKETAR